MQATFDRFWEYARQVVGWSNGMLQPPPVHVLQLFAAAAEHQVIADRLAQGFADPSTFFPWMIDPQAAAAVLAESTAE